MFLKNSLCFHTQMHQHSLLLPLAHDRDSQVRDCPPQHTGRTHSRLCLCSKMKIPEEINKNTAFPSVCMPLWLNCDKYLYLNADYWPPWKKTPVVPLNIKLLGFAAGLPPSQKGKKIMDCTELRNKKWIRPESVWSLWTVNSTFCSGLTTSNVEATVHMTHSSTSLGTHGHKMEAVSVWSAAGLCNCLIIWATVSSGEGSALVHGDWTKGPSTSVLTSATAEPLGGWSSWSPRRPRWTWRLFDRKGYFLIRFSKCHKHQARG